MKILHLMLGLGWMIIAFRWTDVNGLHNTFVFWGAMLIGSLFLSWYIEAQIKLIKN